MVTLLKLVASLLVSFTLLLHTHALAYSQVSNESPEFLHLSKVVSVDGVSSEHFNELPSFGGMDVQKVDTFLAMDALSVQVHPLLCSTHVISRKRRLRLAPSHSPPC